jgi:hypothetical protein
VACSVWVILGVFLFGVALGFMVADYTPRR